MLATQRCIRFALLDSLPVRRGAGAGKLYDGRVSDRVSGLHAIALQHCCRDDGARGRRSNYCGARAAGYIRYPDGNKLAFISQETSGN
jgi:hypothetical protein